MAVVETVVFLLSLLQAQSPSIDDHDADPEAFTSSLGDNCSGTVGGVALGEFGEDSFCSEPAAAISLMPCVSESLLRMI